MRVISGLEKLIETPGLIGERPWALLCNHAAVDRRLDHARVLLPARVAGPLRLLLAPEHGLDAVAQDMEGVEDLRDPLSGLPVRSLYGDDAASLAPRPEDLEAIEVIVVDLPDIGTRYYTYAATMDFVLALAEPRGLEVVVLDRPNPLGGLLREGGMVRAGFESFVSQLPTPVRHGLSLGEIALLLQRERYPNAALTVLACEGWRRDMAFEATGLPWVPPSPNMPTLEAAFLYPGLCLIEATTLSEGRGTTRPFHLVGAPDIDAEAVVAELRRRELPGLAFRPARFRPMFQKHAGKICAGVEIHLLDREALRPLAAGLELLAAFGRVAPQAWTWRPDPYEFVADVPALDLLTGSSRARETLESKAPLDSLLADWQDEVEAFDSNLEDILIYL